LLPSAYLQQKPGSFRALIWTGIAARLFTDGGNQNGANQSASCVNSTAAAAHDAERCAHFAGAENVYEDCRKILSKLSAQFAQNFGRTHPSGNEAGITNGFYPGVSRDQFYSCWALFEELAIMSLPLRTTLAVTSLQ
jgi:hypothetical protein